MRSETVYQPAALPVYRSLARRSALLAVLGIFLLAVLAHLATVLPFLNYPIALDDMFQYDMLARSLAAGQGFRWYARADVEILWPYLSQFLTISKDAFPPEGIVTTFRSPGYPFFLAGLYRLVTPEARFQIARLVQAGLFAWLGPLVYLLARRMRLGSRSAALAGILVALYPILLFYPVGLASENVFIPLVAGSFLALIEASERPTLPRLATAGVLLGLAVLVRSVLALFLPLSAAWLVWALKGKKIRALVPLLTAALICLPWAARNSMILGRPAFIENSLSYNLFIGWHPQGNGEFISSIAILPLNILNDGERDAYCMKSAVGFILDNPAEVGRRIWGRAVAIFGPEDREFFYFYTNNLFGPLPQPWLGLLYLLMVLPWLFTLGFSVPGMLFAPKRSQAWLALLLVAGYAGVHLLILAEPRFHLALVPVLLPFAAHGWQERGKLANLLLRPAPPEARITAWCLRLALIGLLALWLAAAQERAGILPALMSPGGNLLRFAY